MYRLFTDKQNKYYYQNTPASESYIQTFAFIHSSFFSFETTKDVYQLDINYSIRLNTKKKNTYLTMTSAVYLKLNFPHVY